MSLVLNTQKFVPSAQQQIFFDWIKNETGSCVLTAVAGAGKTTTLIKALQLMNGTIFFGAYNKKIASEIQSKAKSQDGLNISTMHAAGFASWRGAVKTSRVDGDKVRNIFNEAVVRNMQYSMFRGPVIQLVSLAKQSGFGVTGFPSIDSKAAWMDLINHHDIETFDEKTGEDNADLIVNLARKTLQASIHQNQSIIDFDDMIYAPLYHNCRLVKYDWVLIDEAQDTNATRRALALGMLKTGGRLVAIGDPKQAIYAFQGADSKAIEMIGEAVSAKQLLLTTTFRCPKEVVKFAQQWVSHIHAAEAAPAGAVTHISGTDLASAAVPGDAILSRYNAPLIDYVYKFIAAGVPAKVEGREIGQGLKALAQRWKVKSLRVLSERLDAYEEREVAKFTAKEQAAKVTAIEDKCACLRVIIQRVTAKDCNTAKPVELVVQEIDSIFSDDAGANVVLLSSIHRSKGREWNKVFVLDIFWNNKRAVKDWQIEQEDNLRYVAATRSMDTLVLVDKLDTKNK